MKIVTVVATGIFLVLFALFLVLQCYIWPVPSNAVIEKFRSRMDTVFWSAWIQHNSNATWLYNTVFHNSDKYVWFPPRVTTIYSERSRVQGYKVFGLVVSWNKDQKLLVLSSYIGKTLYIRFDPDTYGHRAILSMLDMHGVIDLSKPTSIITTLSIPNTDTLFCEGDVFSIETTTWQEIYVTKPDRPIIPKELVLSFRLCQQ